MFGVNSYAKIKEVENKGNYSDCKISISKKNKTTNKYETTFIGKVRFVGIAHNQKPMANQRIKITSCGVSNCYTKDDKLEFMKSPSFVIFDYELQGDAPTSATTSFPNDFGVEVDSGDFPF